MKTNEKRGILILIVVVIIIVAMLHTILRQNNEEAAEGQLVPLEGFKLSDVKQTYEGGKTTIIANVTNKTGSEAGVIPVYIVLLGEEQKELGKISAVVTETKNGQTIQIRTSIQKDFGDVKEYVLVKK